MQTPLPLLCQHPDHDTSLTPSLLPSVTGLFYLYLCEILSFFFEECEILSFSLLF
jgi:hypothetical protein